MSKKAYCLFAAEDSAEQKAVMAFCIYIIATEIDKFHNEICSQIIDLPSKFSNFDFRLSL